MGLEILGAPARQGAEIFSDDEAVQIGEPLFRPPFRGMELIIVGSRGYHFRNPVTHLGFIHRDGLRQERLPQEEHASQGESQEEYAGGRGEAHAICACQVL